MTMKKTVATFLWAAMILVGTARALSPAAALEGLWTARLTEDKIQLRLSVFEEEGRSGEWNTSVTVDRRDVTGLRMDQEHTFELKREAGTLSFTGKFTGNRGSGSFEFVPNREFIETLGRKGYGKITDDKMIFLCLTDINLGYINDLERLGFTEISTSRLVDLGIHRVTAEYIKDMQSVGLRNLSVAKLLEFKIHGVDRDYVQGLKAAGYADVSPAELLELRMGG